MRSFVSRNSADMTHALAYRVAQYIRARLAVVESVTVAFSGTLPLPIFTALACERLDWSRVTVTLVDEHMVPAGSFESHGRLIQHTLLRGQAATAAFEPIKVVNNRCVRNALDLANALYQQPDVVVLGMGTDGRLGLITSDSLDLDFALSGRAEPGYVAVHSRQCPVTRISLNLSAILSARQIFLGISGTDNLEVFQTAQRSACATVPISYLIHQERVALDVYRTQ